MLVTTNTPTVDGGLYVNTGGIVPAGNTTDMVGQFEGSEPPGSSNVGTPQKNANRKKLKADDAWP